MKRRRSIRVVVEGVERLIRLDFDRYRIEIEPEARMN